MHTHDAKIIVLFEMGVVHKRTAFCRQRNGEVWTFARTSHTHTWEADFPCVCRPIPFLVMENTTSWIGNPDQCLCSPCKKLTLANNC